MWRLTTFIVKETKRICRFVRLFIDLRFISRKCNYFYINNYFYHCINSTALGTFFVVVVSDQTVAYFEKKNVSYFTTDSSKRLCWLFIHNYFCFLDAFINSWHSLIFRISIKLWTNLIQIYNLCFEELTTNINFIDINLKLINEKVHFDVHHKPNFF